MPKPGKEGCPVAGCTLRACAFNAWVDTKDKVVEVTSISESLEQTKTSIEFDPAELNRYLGCKRAMFMQGD